MSTPDVPVSEAGDRVPLFAVPGDATLDELEAAIDAAVARIIAAGRRAELEPATEEV